MYKGKGKCCPSSCQRNIYTIEKQIEDLQNKGCIQFAQTTIPSTSVTNQILQFNSTTLVGKIEYSKLLAYY